MKRLTPVIVFILIAAGLRLSPVYAGEPTGEIGPMNPTMFKCIDEDGKELIQPDPFRKPTILVTIKGEKEFDLEQIEEYLAENPDARDLICDSGIDIDFGFDTKDDKAFNTYLGDLQQDCDDVDGKIVPITDTRIEGHVYEFHPVDPENPEISGWFAVPSRNVPVIAKGITFEIFWNSDDNGGYFFRNLGAGPILLNLKLPPDAHAINSNILIQSTGQEETLRGNNLGFYRGDVPPQAPMELIGADGVPLPFLELGDIETLSVCGYDDLPNVAASLDPPLTDSEDTPGIPDVGGVLPPDSSIAIVALATLLLITLPAIGVLKLSRRRRD